MRFFKFSVEAIQQALPVRLNIQSIRPVSLYADTLNDTDCVMFLDSVRRAETSEPSQALSTEVHMETTVNLAQWIQYLQMVDFYGNVSSSPRVKDKDAKVLFTFDQAQQRMNFVCYDYDSGEDYDYMVCSSLACSIPRSFPDIIFEFNKLGQTIKSIMKMLLSKQEKTSTAVTLAFDYDPKYDDGTLHIKIWNQFVFDIGFKTVEANHLPRLNVLQKAVSLRSLSLQDAYLPNFFWGAKNQFRTIYPFSSPSMLGRLTGFFVQSLDSGQAARLVTTNGHNLVRTWYPINWNASRPKQLFDTTFHAGRVIPNLVVDRLLNYLQDVDFKPPKVKKEKRTTNPDHNLHIAFPELPAPTETKQNDLLMENILVYSETEDFWIYAKYPKEAHHVLMQLGTNNIEDETVWNFFGLNWRDMLILFMDVNELEDSLRRLQAGMRREDSWFEFDLKQIAKLPMFTKVDISIFLHKTKLSSTITAAGAMIPYGIVAHTADFRNYTKLYMQAWQTLEILKYLKLRGIQTLVLGIDEKDSQKASVFAVPNFEIPKHPADLADVEDWTGYLNQDNLIYITGLSKTSIPPEVIVEPEPEPEPEPVSKPKIEEPESLELF